MQTLSLPVTTILILIAAIMWVLDMVGRAETIQKRWPRVWNAATSRPLILLLLVVSLFLLDRDFKDAMATAPAPQMKIPTPPPPVIQLQVVAAPRESKGSLRRRTVKLADEYYQYARKRLDDHPPNAYPDSSDPNPSEERKKMIQACQKYDQDTADYYLRHFKDRMVGIIREYNLKGVKTGYLESSLTQRAPAFTLPGSGWEGSAVDELSHFRELAYHVDAQDHLIVF